MTDKKKTILLDLDGVLNTYKSSEFREDFIPPLREGAESFVENLSKIYKIKLFTARKRSQVLDWLSKTQINKFISGVTNIKEPAWLFIDDRCICFNGSYGKLLEDINNFEVWHKN